MYNEYSSLSSQHWQVDMLLKYTLNDKYKNFINAHLEAKYIPTKHWTKSRVPWETLAVREKHAEVKIASKCNRKNPTNTNAQ